MPEMKTCLVIDIIDFTKMCEESVEKAEYVQETLFGVSGLTNHPGCKNAGMLAITTGAVCLYLFDKPLDAVHYAIDLLAEVRKHNAKDIKNEFLIHLAVTLGDVYETSKGIWVGTCINTAFAMAKSVLPNFILVDHMIYMNLRSHPIDFRLITPDDDTGQEYKEAVYSVRTNEVINGRLSRRIDDLGIKINSLTEKINT